MLKGLEIVELKMSELRMDNLTFRIDSEYLKKDYLKNISSLKSKKHIRLKDAIEHLSGGATPLGANYQTYGIKFLRVQNIMQNYFNLNDVVYINAKQDEEIKRSRLKLKDVLLTITGVSYGKSSTVNPELVGANINQHSVKITLNDKLNPYYLSTFLNAKYGKMQSDKNIVGVTRPALDYQVIKNFIVPSFNEKFQNGIEKLILNSQLLILNSKKTYTKAENLLLEEIGLQNFTPSKEPVNIKSFKDSFGTSGRLDAEHYQVKYDIIENTFDKFKRIKLFDLVISPISSGTTPKAGGNAYTNSEEGIPFVRAVDLKGGEVITSNFKYLKHNIHNGILKRTQLKKDDVLLSIAGTVGRSSIFKHNFEANINQAVSILRFKEKEVKRLYLVAFFNSSLGKIFISKYSRQGVQTNLSLTEIGNLSIPIIDYKKQQQIADLIEQSFTLKKQSEHLLEVAKRAVEIAIEENEEIALTYINQETK